MSTTAADIEEYEALTGACGLVDRSERGKLALTGPDAAEFLNGQLTNDIVSLSPGDGCYAAFLTHKGKMLGDLRVLAVTPEPGGPPELLLDTERVALQALFDMIRRFKVGYDVELHKRTLQRGLLSLVGPRARAVLEGAVAAPGPALAAEEHANTWSQIEGEPVLLIATDVGVDVLVDSEGAERVRAALIAAGAVPASEASAEIVRVERGRPRYGVDLDDATIPQEADLNERAVSFTKGCYVGQETVARLYYRGKPNRHLRGLRLSGPAAGGDELRLGDRVVGTLGSAAHSPRQGDIALALVRREVPADAELSVGTGGVTARLAALPFGA
jgi:folate-binding protein YgfZ